MIVTFFPTRSEVNLKNRWTQLSNRSFWELDIQRQKQQLISALDTVISEAALPRRVPPPEDIKESSGSEFGFGTFEWEDGERRSDDFFHAF
jgi:hypothetical protein